jgi:hypothetical protein
MAKARANQPPLHLAVINNDLAAIRLLKNNPDLVVRKNWLGFSAFELAELLANEKASEILQPRIKPEIPVITKENGQLEYASCTQIFDLFGVHYLSALYFESVELLEELASNSPLLLRTFIGEEHRSLGASLRKKLFGGSVPGVSIRWIDETMGYGLFAEIPFKKEQFIGEYVGQVRKIRRLHPDLNGYCLHLPSRLWSWNFYVIDAEKLGNELRFANHSDKPNMQPISLLDRGLLHIGLFAARDIEVGEELTFNYGKDYWRKRQKRV